MFDFAVGDLVKVGKHSNFFDMLLKITDMDGRIGRDLVRVYPINNGDIQTYIFYINEMGHRADYNYILPKAALITAKDYEEGDIYV